MSYNFQGIKSEIINLLCENRFNDSKLFYEEHKEELKQGATIPMRQIILDLSEMMLNMDEKMYTNPIYSVSRIRRDTRHTKDKTLYRENLWLMLRRNKKMYPCAPFFWFEFTPAGFSYGLAFYGMRPSQFDFLRSKIIREPERFFDAIKTAENASMKFHAQDSYKNDRVPNSADELKKYLNAKNMEFSFYDTDLTKINKPSLIDTLKNAYAHLEPLYNILIETYDEMIAEG